MGPVSLIFLGLSGELAPNFAGMTKSPTTSFYKILLDAGSCVKNVFKMSGKSDRNCLMSERYVLNGRPLTLGDTTQQMVETPRTLCVKKFFGWRMWRSNYSKCGGRSTVPSLPIRAPHSRNVIAPSRIFSADLSTCFDLIGKIMTLDSNFLLHPKNSGNFIHNTASSQLINTT